MRNRIDTHINSMQTAYFVVNKSQQICIRGNCIAALNIARMISNSKALR